MECDDESSQRGSDDGTTTGKTEKSTGLVGK
jgi:hypothetical protein